MIFSSNFFLKVRLIGFFRELHVRKFRKFSPDHVYDENFQFYDKKPISGREWKSRVRRRFRKSRVRRRFPESRVRRRFRESRVRRRRPSRPLSHLFGERQAQEPPEGSRLLSEKVRQRRHRALFNLSEATERNLRLTRDSQTFPEFVSGLSLDLFADFPGFFYDLFSFFTFFLR